jgi:hypothetical protein
MSQSACRMNDILRPLLSANQNWPWSLRADCVYSATRARSTHSARVKVRRMSALISVGNGELLMAPVASSTPATN